MIIKGTRFNVADNSGVKSFECIHVTIGKAARIGDVIRGVAKKALPDGRVKKSEKTLAVIVRTKKEIKRTDGSVIYFDDNAVVLIDKKYEPIGTRVFGPIAREVKDKGFAKIASLAPEVI